MSGFKLLAIRPLSGCNQRFLKNLTAGELYIFYKDYKFLNDQGHSPGLEEDVMQIKYSSTIPEDLYNIESTSKTNAIEINISAIVGKNGSGKSSVSEMFLYTLFLVSEKLGLIIEDDFFEKNSKDEEAILELRRYVSDVRNIATGLKSEIFYELDNEIYKLKVENSSIKLYSSKFEKNSYFFTIKPKYITTKLDFQPFFYSILVNYSLYALNTNEIGEWVRAFFHKNDGYQVPIVINPFREKGNININTETYLTRSRLLANILSIPNYKNINQKSSVDKIELYFDKTKDYRFLKNRKVRFTQPYIKNFRGKILKPLFELYFNGEDKYPSIHSPIQLYAETYLIQKLITIPTRYPTYKEFNKTKIGKELQNNYRIIPALAFKYVRQLYEDRSHVTLKVRQVLNFLKENIYKIEDIDFQAKLQLGSVIRQINKKIKKSWFAEIVDYLPPPFLISRIRFTDGSYFEQLSSGEKQKIYSLNSIIYHLKNLDSVHKSVANNNSQRLITYKTINLILDEVELYYHPEFQRSFISELLLFIKRANYKYIKSLNIIFLTHSPFILSDIPIQNIILLDIDSKTGKSKQISNRKQTFSANIHDLLADSFFLQDTFIGRYADSKINKLIKEITKETYSRKDKKLLNLIGDNFLRNSIEEFEKKEHDKNSN